MSMQLAIYKTIVLIEDNEGQAVLIRKNLRRCGIKDDIVHLKQGSDALDYIHGKGKFIGRLKENKLALILDIQLPKIDGINILRHIKEDPETKDISVNIFTARDEPEVAMLCSRLGCTSFTIKPVKYSEFFEKIQNIVNYI